MGNLNNRKKAFVKYTSNGKLILAPPYVGYQAPKGGGIWREITLNLCCTTTTTTSSSTTTTTTV